MNKKVGVSKGRGFTLLELLVTLSIAAILLAVGVPSYITFIDNNRVTSQANDMLYSVNMARSEAIKRGTEVRLVSVAGSDWSGGWNLVADTNNDSDFDDAADILMQWEALNGDGSLAIAATNSPTDTYMAFTSHARVSLITPTVAPNLNMSPPLKATSNPYSKIQGAIAKHPGEKFDK